MEKRHDLHQNHEDFYFGPKFHFVYFLVSEFKRVERKSLKNDEKEKVCCYDSNNQNDQVWCLHIQFDKESSMVINMPKKDRILFFSLSSWF